ncbi:hypothetical protein ACMA46_07960 [Clavibacter sp. Sh2141]|uniref:hypothetical protein n=1 Tax=Clavibacter sp. Sh2141 TaxID=3395374 RepID=UPI0039BC3B9E
MTRTPNEEHMSVMEPDRSASFVHPLARLDAHLVQDFMLTKITLLCAQDADLDEWRFELAAMDDASAPDTRSGNTFLFALTLLRYLHALTCATTPDAAPDLLTFPPGFLDAVTSGDGPQAAAIWYQDALGSSTSMRAPRLWEMAAEYLPPLMPCRGLTP